jgi:hypothetical protein
VNVRFVAPAGAETVWHPMSVVPELVHEPARKEYETNNPNKAISIFDRI